MTNPVQIPDIAVQAAKEEMASRDITFANCDAGWQSRTIRHVLTAALSYLQPFDVAAVRRQGYREGLEAAAKWHEDHAIGYETEHSNLNISDELAAEHRGSATAIRALSAEPSKLQTCEKSQTEHLRISQLENALSSILFEDSDKSEQQRMIDRVKARAVLEDTEPAQGEQSGRAALAQGGVE